MLVVEADLACSAKYVLRWSASPTEEVLLIILQSKFYSCVPTVAVESKKMVVVK